MEDIARIHCMHNVCTSHCMHNEQTKDTARIQACLKRTRSMSQIIVQRNLTLIGYDGEREIRVSLLTADHSCWLLTQVYDLMHWTLYHQ